MTSDNELGRLLSGALTTEVDHMGIDLSAGAARLVLELDRREGRAVRHRWLAAASALVLTVLAGWWVASGSRTSAPATPAPATPLPAPSSTWIHDPADPTPYLVNVRTGGHAPLPAWAIPRDADEALFAVHAGTRRLVESRCQGAFGTGCAPPGAEPVVTSLDVATVARLRIPAGLVAAGFTWSPDGRRLLYSATDGSPAAVPQYYVYELATDISTKVTDIPLDHAFWWSLMAGFTADGRSVLYDLPRDERDRSQWDVWTVPASGGPARRLITDAKTPVAIPGSRDIAFLQPIPGAWEGSAIKVTNGADPGTTRTVVVAVSGIGAVYASPDGSRLAYADDGSTWVVTIGTGIASRVAEGGPGGWLDADTLLIAP